MSEQPPHREYWAFISYSQIDTNWGKWLHRALEQYQVPKRLEGKETGRGYQVPKRAFPVFLDREELPTSANFGRMIETALESSKYLVVICSPNSAQSKWVNEEILAFKKMGREDRILCLIVDGEPNASDGKPGFSPEDECFAPAMRFKADDSGDQTEHRLEPLAADARTGRDGKTNAKLKILAGVLGVAYDELVQRDHARKMRRMWSFTALSLCLMSTMAALAVLFLLERNRAQDALSARYELAAREASLGSQFGESILYFDAARELGRELDSDPAFASAWSRCQNLKDQFRTDRAPVFATFTPHAKHIVVQDQLGGVTIRNVETQTTVWHSESGSIECSTPAFSGDFVVGIVSTDGAKKLEVRQLSNQALVFSKPWPAEWTTVRDLMVSEDGRYAFYRKIPALPGETERQAVVLLEGDGPEVEVESVKSLNLAAWWFGPNANLLYHTELEGFTGMALRVWKRETGQLLKEIAIQQKILHQVHSKDHLVLGFEGGMIACLHPETLEVQWTWQSDTMPAPVVDLVIRDETIHALDGMSQYRVLNLADGTLISDSQSPRRAIACASLAKEGLVTGDRKGILQHWTKEGLQLEEAWHPDALSSVAVSPNGQFAMAGARNGLVRIWNANALPNTASFQVVRRDGDPFRMMHHVIGGSSDLLLATDAGLIKKTANGTSEIRFDQPLQDLVTIANNQMGGITTQGNLVWFSSEGEFLQEFPMTGEVAGASSYQLASSGEDLVILAGDKAWFMVSKDGDFREGAPLPSSLQGKPITTFRTSADGSELLVAGFGGTVQWDLKGEANKVSSAESVERLFAWEDDILLWRTPGFALHAANLRAGTSQQLAPQVAAATLIVRNEEPLIAFSTPKGEVTIQTLEGEQVSWFQHPQARSAGNDVLLQNAAKPGGGMILSPNGNHLITSHGFAVYLWDWKNGTLAWKSPELPAGMFGQLSVDHFVTDNQLLVYEGLTMPGQGFPGAYLVSIPSQTPDSEVVRRFGREILGLQMKNGLLKRQPN